MTGYFHLIPEMFGDFFYICRAFEVLPENLEVAEAYLNACEHEGDADLRNTYSGVLAYDYYNSAMKAAQRLKNQAAIERLKKKIAILDSCNGHPELMTMGIEKAQARFAHIVKIAEEAGLKIL